MRIAWWLAAALMLVGYATLYAMLVILAIGVMK